MRFALAMLMLLHGLAHLPGFLVPWRIAHLAELPYGTTVLMGRMDVGDAGIRVVGLLWLLAAIGFCTVAAGVLADRSWWAPLTWAFLVGSTALVALAWPAARVGLLPNLLILAALLTPPARVALGG
jgi:hypothetical protein